MKRSIFLSLILAGATVASSAQTTTKPASTTATPHAASASSAATKLPPGIPPIKALTKNLFVAALRYQDAVVGKGPLAEPGKLYTIHYSGYLAADGTKFDSSHDHPESAVIGKDGKPELGEDGKPKKLAGQPIQFVQGAGRTIPGFDLGFEGMHIGGKRRLFIPWQLGYGLRGMPSPDPKHTSIPSKADLIFDVELLDVSEPPARPAAPQRPMGGRPNGMPPHPGQPGQPGQPNVNGQPGQPRQPGTPRQPATPQTGTPAPAPATTPTPAAPTTTPAPTAATPAPAPATTTPIPAKPADQSAQPKQ
jgi:peptidylprolyl isomerase